MTWQHHPDVVWDEDADGIIYATVATDGEILVLQATAAEIFALADGATTDHITSQLATATGAPADEVRPAVDQFLTNLQTRGVVQHV